MTVQYILDRADEHYDCETSWWDDYYQERSEYGDNGDDAVYLHDDGDVY